MISIYLLLMVLLLKSQGMKHCKNAESFCLSILTIYLILTGPLKFWHVYCCHVYFFSARILNMWMSRTTFYLLWRAGPPGLGFYGSRPARLPSWLGMVNAGRLGSMRSEIFLKMKFIILQGCPTKQADFYLGSPLHIISTSFSHFCLFENVISHKMLKLVSWNFKPIFHRMQFSLVATFFSLVLIICLSWYLNLKLFHEILTFVSSNIWRWKCNSIRYSHLELVIWHSGSQMVFPNI